MTITLNSTDLLTTYRGVPVRIWEGYSANGVPVQAIICMVGALLGSDQTEFEAELKEVSEPVFIPRNTIQTPTQQ